MPAHKASLGARAARGPLTRARSVDSLIEWRADLSFARSPTSPPTTSMLHRDDAEPAHADRLAAAARMVGLISDGSFPDLSPGALGRDRASASSSLVVSWSSATRSTMPQAIGSVIAARLGLATGRSQRHRLRQSQGRGSVMNGTSGPAQAPASEGARLSRHHRVGRRHLPRRLGHGRAAGKPVRGPQAA